MTGYLLEDFPTRLNQYPVTLGHFAQNCGTHQLSMKKILHIQKHRRKSRNHQKPSTSFSNSSLFHGFLPCFWPSFHGCLSLLRASSCRLGGSTTFGGPRGRDSNTGVEAPSALGAKARGILVELDILRGWAVG